MIGQYIDCLRIRHLLVIYTCISKYFLKKKHFIATRSNMHTPRYSLTTANVGVKHQSINQSINMYNFQ